MRINANIEGLLNWIDDNFIAQCTGYGIYTTYRFYDSWIVNNNIGSSGPNLSIESGPVRIIANHLDGEPSNNIELRGCKSLNIIGNICENARKEAIVFAMPSWMDSDNEQVAIVGNNITNGGKADPNAYPAIGIYSVDSDHRTWVPTSPATSSPMSTRVPAGPMPSMRGTSTISRSQETNGTTTVTALRRCGPKATTSELQATHREM